MGLPPEASPRRETRAPLPRRGRQDRRLGTLKGPKSCAPAPQRPVRLAQGILGSVPHSPPEHKSWQRQGLGSRRA